MIDYFGEFLLVVAGIIAIVVFMRRPKAMTQIDMLESDMLEEVDPNDNEAVNRVYQITGAARLVHSGEFDSFDDALDWMSKQ